MFSRRVASRCILARIFVLQHIPFVSDPTLSFGRGCYSPRISPTLLLFATFSVLLLASLNGRATVFASELETVAPSASPDSNHLGSHSELNGTIPLPSLTLEADTHVVSQTEQLSLSVRIDSVVLLSGYRLAISYNPALFDFEEAHFESYFSPSSEQSVSFDGPSTLIVQQRGAAATGPGNLVTLRFAAKPSATGIDAFSLTPNHFESAEGQIFSGASASSSVDVRIAARSTLEGVVNVQGRTDKSGVSVYLYPGEEQKTTDVTGAYQLTGAWPTRENTVLFQLDGYLAHVEHSVIVGEGETKKLPSVVLYGGDINQDGRINMQDLGFLGGHFGLPISTSEMVKADINGDGVINILDLTMTAGNYGAVSNVQAVQY